MKQVKKDLQGVLKSLKLAAGKVEKLMKKVEKLDKPRASKKPKAKVMPKASAPKKVSDSDAVLAISEDTRKELTVLL